jgi:DNA methylase/ParB-like nuclease domain
MDVPNSPQHRIVAIDSLKPYPGHARRHDKLKLDKLSTLIRVNGQIAPVIIDGDGVIIDGHAAWEVMKGLAYDEISVAVVANRSVAEIRALRLSLNRAPSDAKWDREALRIELQDFLSLGFDMELTAFDAVEIDALLEIPPPVLDVVNDEESFRRQPQPAVSTTGDIWICGAHRVACGDALNKTFLDKVLAGRLADVCIIDPHFHAPIEGADSAIDNFQRREFLRGRDEMSPEQITRLLTKSLSALKASSSEVALIYAFTDWRRLYEILCAGRGNQLNLLNLCVWETSSAGADSFYKSAHELVCVFTAESAGTVTDKKSAKRARRRSDLWKCRNMNALGIGRDEAPAPHSALKPVAMLADVIRDATKRRAIVLDTFVGPGSTIMAAEETGRSGIGIDLDPLCVDVTVRRWQDHTRRDAIHAGTGECFEDRANRLASVETEA